MKCLRPLYIHNTSRFICEGERHRMVIQVPCGKCANCQNNKRAEWSYRIYRHFEHNLKNGHYMLFDTLTYDDKHLPKFKDFEEFSMLPDSLNHSCFRAKDLTDFHKRLRKALSKKYGKGCYSYFVASEYGSIDHTFRPHYHCLFFVRKDVLLFEFSAAVAVAWQNGRTDGLPFRSRSYVRSNQFNTLSAVARRKCNYVAKYVVKSSQYSKVVNRRISAVLYSLYGFDLDALSSDDAVMTRRLLRRLTTQFHRQSLSFGLGDLSDISMDVLSKGFLLMPNGKATAFNRVPLPTYFLRKLAYDKVKLSDGAECWSIRPECKSFLIRREASLISSIADSLKCAALTYGYKPECDWSELARYSYKYRGRLVGYSDELLTVPQRLASARYFVYASSADVNHFGRAFVTDVYLGHNGAYLPVSSSCVSLDKVLTFFLYNDSFSSRWRQFDAILDKFDALSAASADCKQEAADVVQRVVQISKAYS